MPTYNLEDKAPQIHPSAYIAPGAHVIDDVLLEASTSVWFNAVLRGDTERITIGEGSNIQDGAVAHADPGFPCTVGRNCVVGHGAIIHGCEIGDDCLIGMGAIVLNGAKLGSGCVVAAGALVPEGKEFPPNSLLMGIPATPKREVTPELLASTRSGATHYQQRARQYRQNLFED